MAPPATAEEQQQQQQYPLPSRPTKIDGHVWEACAVPLSRLPAAGAKVFYFPDGHSEQSSSPPDFSALTRARSAFSCTIRSVRLYADHETDEVFAFVSLLPGSAPVPSPEVAAAEDNDGKLAVCYFAKQLTPSDANNGGGFSVPRNCADNIFPKLDFDADPPVQTLSLCDMHGQRWDFRHIYRGTPRRHLLTTGWSRFVNEKKLVAGDTVVFMRRAAGAGDLLVGVRRAPRYLANGSRHDVRARVPAAAVAEAARCAEQGRPFDVVYYPRQGAGEFLVQREVVDAAMRVPWKAGLQVRMPVMEVEESRRLSWPSGTVTAIAPRNGPWIGSPWRALQVTWDKSTLASSRTSRYVSPWQVEVLGDVLLLKKPTTSETAEPFSSGDGNMAVQLTGSENENVEDLSSSINCSSFPAGMQGARHGLNSVPGLSAPMNINQLSSEILFGSQIPLRPSDFSEAVNPENGSQLNGSVQPDQSSNLDSDTYPSAIPTSGDRRSIQLFGRTITFVQPTDNDAPESCIEVAAGFFEQGSSVAGPHDRLLSGADVHNQRDSSQEASC